MKKHYRASGILQILMFSAFFLPLPALGQTSGEAEFSRLLEGAKKEGELVVYGSSGVFTEPLRAKFQRKYPFLRVTVNGLSGARIHSKVMMEARAKKLHADVIQALEFNMYSFRKTGILEKYNSPESRYLDIDG